MFLLLVLLALSCTSRTPAEYAARQKCLATADLVADARADRECPLAQSWESCPTALDIEAEHKAELEACQ